MGRIFKPIEVGGETTRLREAGIYGIQCRASTPSPINEKSLSQKEKK